MTKKPPNLTWRVFLIGSLLLLLKCSAAYGQGDVPIKNTAKEIRPGLYECRIYLALSKGLLETIADVTYTLPPGYPNRTQKGQKITPGLSGGFSSNPITTAEEAVVNVKITYKNSTSLYRSYKLKLFNARVK